MPHQIIIDGRIYEAVGEDGGCPVCRLHRPQEKPSNTQLLGFHLSLPMGYVDTAPYFCMVTETVADLANESISQRYQAHEHPLEMAAEARAADNSSAPESQADASW